LSPPITASPLVRGNNNPSGGAATLHVTKTDL
jgi:hypothetical protein